MCIRDRIYLESELFFSGVRPAVNVGLSVSRVGGAAQTKAMKKIAGSLRIDLAQFRELEVFTQFSSDLDQSTKDSLEHGKRLVEILKQPLYQPMSLHKQVILLYAATNRLLMEIPISQIRAFGGQLVEYMEQNCPEAVNEIDTTKQLSETAAHKIAEAVEELKKQVSA